MYTQYNGLNRAHARAPPKKCRYDKIIQQRTVSVRALACFTHLHMRVAVCVCPCVDYSALDRAPMRCACVSAQHHQTADNTHIHFILYCCSLAVRAHRLVSFSLFLCVCVFLCCFECVVFVEQCRTELFGYFIGLGLYLKT